jgi:hypothetical protein
MRQKEKEKILRTAFIILMQISGIVLTCTNKNLMRSGIKISICVGNVYENAFLFSLNKTFKAGDINISDYENRRNCFTKKRGRFKHRKNII